MDCRSLKGIVKMTTTEQEKVQDKARFYLNLLPMELVGVIIAIVYNAHSKEDASIEAKKMFGQHAALFKPEDLENLKKRSIQVAQQLAKIMRDYGERALSDFLASFFAEKPLSTEWVLGSGQKVFDRADSHVSQEAKLLLGLALLTIKENNANFINVDHNFGCIIGQTICVETKLNDQIVFANRIGRQTGHTRFVLNRRPESTSWLTVALRPLADGNYEIRTAYIGKQAPPEPWDRWVLNQTKELERSRDFWANHALIWDESKIITGTQKNYMPEEWVWLKNWRKGNRS